MWLPMVMLAFSTAAIAALNYSTAQSVQLSSYQRRQADREAVTTIGASVEQFLLENSRFPLSLNELVSSPAHSDVSRYLSFVGYHVVEKQDVAIDRMYKKAVVFIKKNPEQSDSDFLSSNDCGVEHFDSAVEWCKKDGSLYAVTDDRQYQRYLASESIVRLDYLSQQIFNARTTNGFFPKTMANNADLSDGSVTTVSAAAGFSGSANSCNGTFLFDGALLTCEFLFALDGTPIYYIRENDDNVVLYVDLPVRFSNGEPHRIARPLRIL